MDQEERDAIELAEKAIASILEELAIKFDCTIEQVDVDPQQDPNCIFSVSIITG